MKHLTTAHIEQRIASLEATTGVYGKERTLGFLHGLLAALKPMEELAAQWEEEPTTFAAWRFAATEIRQRIHDTIEKHGGIDDD